jgi:hypothetical protein
MHNAAFAHLGLNKAYFLLEVMPRIWAWPSRA